MTFVPKPDGQLRFCIDYRKINTISKADSYPSPKIDSCINQFDTAVIISKIDLMKGYWQVLLTLRTQEISILFVNDQIYKCNVMPFCLKNAPATFQRFMHRLTQGYLRCAVYIDDVTLYSYSWQDHLDQISMIFSCLSIANLVINLLKCEFVKSCTICRLCCKSRTGRTTNNKGASYRKIPCSPKRRYLEMVNYFRRFTEGFSKITAPLTDHQKRSTGFV